MKPIKKTIEKVNQMTWQDLQSLVEQEINTVPAKYHIIFEYAFQQPWLNLVKMLKSLSGKDYPTISDVHNKLLMYGLGDLSESDVVELTIVSWLNMRDKSPKVEYYLISRMLHTRHREDGVIAKIRHALEELM